jgi:hypothetical protein
MKKAVKRAGPGISILTVLVTMSAWLVISNHCALGAAVTEASGMGFQSGSDHRQDADATKCPFHSKRSAPTKPKQSSASPCCKILRAIVTSSGKNFVCQMADLVNVDLAFAKLLVFAPPKISFRGATLDTGPPGATSFAELVLQRSILAHAPPSLA